MKLLPLGTPVISPYPMIASLHSVIAAHEEDTLNWVLNNYVQIIYTHWEYTNLHGKKVEIQGNFTDAYFNYNVRPIYKMPFFYHDKISNAIIKRKWVSFAEFIQDYIDENYYVMCYLNTKYIPHSPNYLVRDFDHLTFIFGYDESNKVVHIADHYDMKAYDMYEVSFDQLNQAFIHTEADAECIKVHDEIQKSALNVNSIKNKLIQYQNSLPDCELVVEPVTLISAHYGLSYYDKLVQQINNGNVDYRAVHILCNHKSLMQKRLQALYEHNHIDCESYTGLSMKNDELLNLSTVLRNAMVKYQMKPSGISKLILQCEELNKLDAEFVSKLVQVL